MYLLKVNNKNTRARCEICSKLIKTTERRRHWSLSIPSGKLRKLGRMEKTGQLKEFLIH